MLPVHCESIFLLPFAPRALPRFNATTKALTSERRLFVPVGSHAGIRHMNTVLSVQLSLFTGLNLPTILFPTTPHRPRNSDLVLVRDLPRDSAFADRTPRGAYGVIWASPLTRRLATMNSRIEFVVILRTGRSPPVAPHPASRRRSYAQIQSSDPTLTRTCTSLIQTHHKRTSPGFIRSFLTSETPVTCFTVDPPRR